MKTILILLIAASCYGASAWDNALADSIYKAEGGAKASHAYGILAHYKTTTPKQACLNTIKSSKKRWVAAGKPCDFVEYLSRTYCPVGALNDPLGLNKNWYKNVTFYMKQQHKPLNPPCETGK